ncbi:MAG: hypothetical protein QOD51_2944 [Candidatus Eremiobacteraeota bacterium]|jgi:hypothetical protein|nr:hypothetical protein [Candidatus Eremiobacteraeota bacterium]
MAVRSFVTNVADGTLSAGAKQLRGIAFDGGSGIKRMEISRDNGATWRDAALERDYGNTASDAGMAFKPGTGLGAVQANCSSGHSSAYVSTQPALTRAQWTAEVVKMKSAYGAPIADEQVPVIVEYPNRTTASRKPSARAGKPVAGAGERLVIGF